MAEGAYTLVLEFETKKDMTMDMWTDRIDKIESFFGPGITAKVSLCRACLHRSHHDTAGDLATVVS